MTEDFLSQAEQEAIDVLVTVALPPEPGERCALCNRRRNKERQTDSPTTREMRIKLPTERMEWAEEAFDALQQVVGADPYSYPRGQILEALLVIGGQQREQLKAYFEGSE